MQERGASQATLDDIEAHQLWLAKQPGYRLDRPRSVNDAFCLAWASTTAAREFACRWSTEVMLFSMREQLSFDHARRTAKAMVTWIDPLERGWQRDGPML